MEAFDEGIGARIEASLLILNEMIATFNKAEETLEDVLDELNANDGDIGSVADLSLLKELIKAIDYEEYGQIKHKLHLIQDDHRPNFY